MPKTQDIISRASQVRDIAVCLTSYTRVSVLAAISQGADTYEKLAQRTGMGYELIKHTVADLRTAGIVTTDRRGYGGRHGGHTRILFEYKDEFTRDAARFCGLRNITEPEPNKVADIDKIISSLKQQRQ